MNFAEFILELKSLTHPAGLPQNLEAAYEKIVIEGLIGAQKWVSCLRESHTDIFDFADTWLYCYMTSVVAPNGRIARVYTVAEDDFCDPVEYRQMDYDELKCEARKVTFDRDLLPYASYSQLPEPFAYASYAGVDVSDKVSGRFKYGFYSIHNGRIYTAPYLNSTERLVIEWQGLKRSYADSDVIDDDPELLRVIRLFVTKEIALHYERDELIYAGATREYMEALADLAHECNEKIRIRESHLCVEDGCSPSC